MRRLVLVGAGHAHVQVLRGLAMRPLQDVEVTLVVDRPVAVYSGMVPGHVAGDYAAHELAIDARPLARRAGARIVVAAATRIDPRERLVHVEGRPPVPWDLASVDVGSVVAGAELPGATEHAVPTRPIARFLERIDAALADMPPDPRIVVVGLGAGGVELAFTLDARLRRAGRTPRVTLVGATDRVLSDRPPGLSRRIEAALTRRGITLVTGARVTRFEAGAVVLDDGRTLAHDQAVLVSGAAAPAVLKASPLPLDPQGFVRVRETLQVEGFDDLFAAGDCAAFGPRPLPKAGVYAVREGPVLDANLRARLCGTTLTPYRPQSTFLALYNLGDGTAIGSRGRWHGEGAWLMRLKDWIDRRFMVRFQLLGPDGAPTDALPLMDEAMACGGCAAKLDPAALSRVLSRRSPPADPDVLLGLQDREDVAAVRVNGTSVVASVDGFPAFTDDPWLVGRVAAANAVSDLHAKGATPRAALAWVGLPERADPEATLGAALDGVRHALDRDGVPLVGGHTTLGESLTVGLTVLGSGDPTTLLRKGGLLPGDHLVLTRALGTGVLWRADAQGLAAGPWMEAAVAAMTRGNATAAAVARRFGLTAATDITGFGLLGHLLEMLEASGATATLDPDRIPALPGVLGLLGRGLRSTAHPRNAIRRDQLAPGDTPLPRVDLLFDPQTGGGLLFGVPAARSAALVDALRAANEPDAAVIGEVADYAAGPRVGLGYIAV